MLVAGDKGTFICVGTTNRNMTSKQKLNVNHRWNILIDKIIGNIHEIH